MVTETGERNSRVLGEASAFPRRVGIGKESAMIAEGNGSVIGPNTRCVRLGRDPSRCHRTRGFTTSDARQPFV